MTCLVGQTSKWHPKPNGQFLEMLAERCEGYCGADLKALCTEAALLALRRHFPQLYDAEAKLAIDVNAVQIEASDFSRAIQNLTPAQQVRVYNVPFCLCLPANRFCATAVLQLNPAGGGVCGP